MNPKASNAALAILFSGASIIAPVQAQDASKPTPGAALQYVGADTRLGVGIDRDNNVRGELFQVLRGDESTATLVELSGSKNVAGAKLSQHWASGTSSVNKLFVALDQGEHEMRKATVGGGQEFERWFWNGALSKGLSGARLTSTAAIANTVTQTGTDAGRPFEQDTVTTVTTRGYERPYDWGVGARAGHFYESALVRVTAGIDYEWGKYSSRQWTGSLVAEKFFAGSPISVALSGEINRRAGDFESTRNDRRGFLMLRYELGAPRTSFKPNKITRSVTTTERVSDPSWKAPVALANTESGATATTASGNKPGEPTTRVEKRVTRSSANDAQETYFDLGSARLKPAALKELDAVASRISAQQPYAEIKVNIVGHTCPTGSDRNNIPLSHKRAEAVKAYLVTKGVPATSVVTTGLGGKSPKYPEVKGQSFRNRRADTEIVVVKEKVEEVKVVVPAPAESNTRPVTPALAASPVATAPMIDRQVTRDVVEEVSNNWISRALHNPAQHKTSVDAYRWVQSSSEQAIGAKRYLNRLPTAVNDSYTVDCGAPSTFNVLANDTDPDGDALTITGVSTPGKGSATISAGKVVYTPNVASCAGTTDSFTYTISDGKGGTSTATVAVTIRSNNNAPVAVNDAYEVPFNTATTLDVLANDSDKDGDALTIASVTSPGKGTAVISGGKIEYTSSSATFSGGSDSFTYTIIDGKGGSATATVSVTIRPGNNAPVAVNDAYEVPFNTATTFDVLANDTDKDGDPLTITSVTAPGKGTAVVSGGKIVYTSNTASAAGGTDTFSYSISDGKGGTSTAIVNVTIRPAPPINNAPVALDDAYTVPFNTATTLDVLANDSDKDGDPLTITGVTAPGKGTAVISGGKIVYTSNTASAAGGTDTFRYTISDGKGGTSTASVNVTIRSAAPLNNAPVALDDAYTVPFNTATALDVLANDSDKDGDPLTITSVTAPGKGTAVISGGKIVYTSNSATTVAGGTDSFSYTISDGKGGTSTATVSVVIRAATPLNNAPVALDDAYTVPFNTATTLDVLANDSDKDGDPLTITAVTAPGKGTAVILGGKIVYTSNSATTAAGGTDSFSYSISDGRGGTATATVNVVIRAAGAVNNAPVAVDDVYTVPCSGTFSLDVLANDSDKDGDALTITSITQPTNAKISIGPNGKSLIYSGGSPCFVRNTFTYTISDGKGGTATATVTLIDP